MTSNFTRILALSLTLLAFAGIVKAQSVNSIQIKTQQGDISFADYKGQVIYLDFWASWCAPCKKSFPWLSQMQAKYKSKGFKVIAVNLDKDQGLAKKFLENNPAGFQVGFDPAGNIAKQLKVTGMPSSFLIDRAGNIVSTHVGFREKDTATMESKIKNLLISNEVVSR